MKTKPALFTAGLALLLTACAQQNAQQGNSQADEIKQLNAKLAEKEMAVKLSAQRTTELEKQYTDMYFELDSLTVDSFKAKVARGDTFYAYIGRPSCSDCSAFEPIREHRLNGKPCISCSRTKPRGRRLSSNMVCWARLCWQNTAAASKSTSWTRKKKARCRRRILKRG